MTNTQKDIWCCSCGDRTCYAVNEGRDIAWAKVDKPLGIGLCKACAKTMTPAEIEHVFKEARCETQD